MKSKKIMTYACALMLACSCTLSACGEEASPSVAEGSSNDSAVTTEAAEKTDTNQDSASSYLDVSDVDFQSVDQRIAFGDFDALSALAKSIQSLDAVDKVVEIEGQTGLSSTTHSIVEQNASDNQSVGAQFEVIGFDSADYPGDGVRVSLVGVVRVSDNGTGVIVVPQDKFVMLGQGGTVINLSDAVITVPEDWAIEKDASPSQLVLSSGSSRIEFWCGETHASEVLNGAEVLSEWNINNEHYLGYSKSKTDYELVTGTLSISATDIYWEDLERFLEYSVKI